MRLIACVMLSACAFGAFLWWVGSTVRGRERVQPAAVYTDPRDRIEIQETIAPPPREELREQCGVVRGRGKRSARGRKGGRTRTQSEEQPRTGGAPAHGCREREPFQLADLGVARAVADELHVCFS